MDISDIPVIYSKEHIMNKRVIATTVGLIGLSLLASGCNGGEDDVETTATPVVVSTPSESATPVETSEPTESASPTDTSTTDDDTLDVTAATEVNQQILQEILADQTKFIGEFGLKEGDKFASGDLGDGNLSVNFGDTPGAVGTYTYPDGLDDIVVTGDQNEFSIISVIDYAIVTTSYSGLLGSDALGAVSVEVEDGED